MRAAATRNRLIRVLRTNTVAVEGLRRSRKIGNNRPERWIKGLLSVEKQPHSRESKRSGLSGSLSEDLVYLRQNEENCPPAIEWGDVPSRSYLGGGLSGWVWHGT